MSEPPRSGKSLILRAVGCFARLCFGFTGALLFLYAVVWFQEARLACKLAHAESDELSVLANTLRDFVADNPDVRWESLGNSEVLVDTLHRIAAKRLPSAMPVARYRIMATQDQILILDTKQIEVWPWPAVVPAFALEKSDGEVEVRVVDGGLNPSIFPEHVRRDFQPSREKNASDDTSTGP